jgi:capsular polysaccharide transport system permease protein
VKKINFLFAFTVVFPTLIAVIYYTFLAADVYISISKFVVRSPDKPASSGIGIILKTVGFSNASDEIYAVQSYVSSRDALKTLDKDINFKKLYTKPSISFFDRFNPTGFFGTFEDLYYYYNSKVGVDYDQASSISTLAVNAYTPEDARLINERLLEMAEATVNRLNARGRQDLVRYAQVEVNEAKERAGHAALAMARFRNSARIIDPEKQATIQMQMISKLQDELIVSQARIMELRKVAPLNPQIEIYQTRVAALKDEIQNRTNDVAGNAQSLSARAVHYQRLMLESQVADKQLAGALASLEEARNEARRKQAYVERIVQPNLPDAALQPRRLKGIITTFLLGMVAWAIISMLHAGVREHRD